MSFLDKLMFWRKDPAINLDASIDTGASGFGGPDLIQSPNLGMYNQDPYSQPAQQPMQRPNYSQPSFDMNYDPGRMETRTVQQPQADTYEKNLEIVSMKLDNLRAALENINQRLINIERIAIDSQRQERQRRNW
jgi:hypothetical protein